MTRDLADLMREVTDDLPHVDLADSAWARAHRSRRGRLVAAGAAASVAAVAVAGVAALGPSDAPPPQTPATRTTSPALPPSSPVLGNVTVTGGSVDLAPDPDAEARLPRLQPSTFGLPESPGFGADDSIAPLATPLPGRVRMIMLRVVEPRRTWRPVLYVVDDGGAGRLYEVPITLGAAYDLNDNATAPLGPRAVSQDGRRVVFAQLGEAVVVDLGSAAVQRIPAPRGLPTAGWDGADVVLRSDTSVARIDLKTGRREVTAVPPKIAMLTPPNSPIAALEGIAPYAPNAAHEADAVTLHEEMLGDGRHQGVAVMSWPRQVLAAPPDRRVPKLGLRPLGWIGSRLLVASTSYAGDARTERILAWGVGASTLHRVADVGPISDLPGGFSGQYALGP